MKSQEEWQNRIIFANATPIEPLETCITISVPPKVHTVISTDGSQIAPNHHEIAYCYLLNIGRVVLHYGQDLHPILDSLPEVFYRPEDLYISPVNGELERKNGWVIDVPLLRLPY